MIFARLFCPDARIRQTVLQNLTEKFDRHLAQADNVRTLFLALNDVVSSFCRLRVENSRFEIISISTFLSDGIT